MDLVKCPICGELYSESYKACPFCAESGPFEGTVKRRKGGGRRVERRRGPNILGPALILVFLLLAGLLVYTFFGDRITEALRRGEREDPPVVETQLILEPADAALTVGEIRALNASGAETLVWSSSDEAVVAVDQTGNVTALTAGTAVITVTDGGEQSAQCHVTVQEAQVPVDDPGNNEDPGHTDDPGNNEEPGNTDHPGGENSETPTPAPDLAIGAIESGSKALPTTMVNGERVHDITLRSGSVHLLLLGTDSEPEWSSNSAAVTVNANGVITRVGSGTAIITATVNGQTIKCRVLG